MRDQVPPQLFERIQVYLENQSLRGEDGWEAGDEEEDTLTGDFCSSLRRGWTQSVRLEGKRWRWRIRYKKFRGRGPGAEERALGADGIVQIEVTNVEDDTSVTKGILFQSKKEGTRDIARLLDQCRKMERLLSNGSAVFVFGPQKYRAFPGRTAIQLQGNIADGSSTSDERIGHFLSREFLTCNEGKRGLYYDALRHVLVVPDETTGVILTRPRLKHRLSIEVQNTV